VTLKLSSCLLKLTIEKELSRIVKGIPIVFRLFPNANLQKRQVLRAGLSVISVVVNLKANPLLHLVDAVSRQDFVDWVLPSVVMTSVNFVAPILETRNGFFLVFPVPGVLITGPSSFWLNAF
jgi:hypothetical protein